MRRPPRRAPIAQPVVEIEESHSVFEDAIEVVEIVEAHPEALTARELLAGETLDPAGLRRAIILSEILSPPLAIRSSGSSPSPRWSAGG